MEILDSLQEAIVSYYEGELTQNQADELLRWASKSEENLHYFRQIGEIWHGAKGSLSMQDFNTKNSLGIVRGKIKERGVRPLPAKEIRLKLSTLMRVAAGLLLLVSLGIAGVFIFSTPKSTITTASFVETFSPKGSRSMVILADGTTVWLNAGTKLRYPVDYGTANRNVYLKGEAYFKVAKNKKLPFKVNTSDIILTALGTAFNVKAYGEEETIETTLEEGRVRIESVKSKKNTEGIEAVVLKPNQNAIYHKQDLGMAVTEKKPGINNLSALLTEHIKPIPVKVTTVADTRLFTSWKDSRWIFKNEKLSALASKLERRYDVNIIFADSILRDYAFTGNLKEESIEQVLQVISFTSPIRFEINFKEVRLFEDKKQKDNYQQVLNP